MLAYLAGLPDDFDRTIVVARQLDGSRCRPGVSMLYVADV